jgi:hypothetical protein
MEAATTMSFDLSLNSSSEELSMNSYENSQANSECTYAGHTNRASQDGTKCPEISSIKFVGVAADRRCLQMRDQQEREKCGQILSTTLAPSLGIYEEAWHEET